MRSPTFLKFSGALFVVMLLALSLSTTLAGPVAQATPAATSAAVSFPPCPPAGGATAIATVSAAGAASAATGTAGVTDNAATANPPGYIGIRVVTVDGCGVRILEILPNTPAANAGFKAEDVIVAVNGTAFSGADQLRQIMNNYHAGDTLQMTVQRAGSNIVVPVTLAAPPANFPPTVEGPSAGAAATAAVPPAGAATPAATTPQ